MDGTFGGLGTRTGTRFLHSTWSPSKRQHMGAQMNFPELCSYQKERSLLQVVLEKLEGYGGPPNPYAHSQEPIIWEHVLMLAVKPLVNGFLATAQIRPKRG